MRNWTLTILGFPNCKTLKWVHPHNIKPQNEDSLVPPPPLKNSAPKAEHEVLGWSGGAVYKIYNNATWWNLLLEAL